MSFLLPGESQTRDCSSADSHPIPCWQGCGQVGAGIFCVKYGCFTTRPIIRVDGVNAVELTKKIRSHAAAAPPATLPAAPKVLTTKCVYNVNVNLIMISFYPGGPGHKVETIDPCSQVHAVHEGRNKPFTPVSISRR